MTSLFNKLIHVGGWIQHHPDLLKVPALLIQGDEDPIVDSKANVHFFTKAKEKNPEIEIWRAEKGKHEVFNDVEREEMFVQMEKFLAARKI